MVTNTDAVDQRKTGKIEIWANAGENEFAICLDIDQHHFRAKTDIAMPDEKFVKMVDQTDFIDDLKYYWAYTLEHWLQRRKVSKKAHSTDVY